MELISFALIGFAGILTFLALAVPLARWLSVPLPVVIAGAGLAYGAVASGWGVTLSGATLDPYDFWFLQQISLDSNALLYLFLPPLLFEMALAVNVRRMLDELPIVLIMAVLAVVVATAVIGMLVWWVSPLALIPALLIGAAVATTDPAAVVSTFREIGAPRRLTVILEGESLLNDAAAITIFSLLLGAAAAGPEALQVSDLLIGFARTFTIGALTGLGTALLGSRLYPLLRGSTAAEVSLTLAVAYGAFVIAEDWFGASGVVAVVFAGLATGSVSFVRMGPRNWSTVTAIWQQIGFWASGLILLLVSALTPGMLVALEGWQALLLIPVYLGALAARAVVLWGVLPLMDRAGLATPITRPQKLLVLWGGVRGAVTLVLALSLGNLPALGPDARLVGAMAAGYALLTLVLNASTLAWVTRRLGLDRLSLEDLALRERIVEGSFTRVKEAVGQLSELRRLAPDTRTAVEDDLRAAQADARGRSGGGSIRFGRRLRLGLAILCAQEERLVRRGFEAGATGPRVTMRLRLQADRISDGARQHGRAGYMAACERGLRHPPYMRAAVFLQRWLRWDRPLRAAIELHLAMMLESERHLGILDRFAAGSLSPMVGEDVTENLRALLARRREAVDAAIGAVGLQYPAYAAALDRALVARAALRRERQEYDRLFRDGVIGPELHTDLSRGLDRRERRLGAPPRLDLARPAAELLERAPIFAALSQAQREKVARKLRTRFTTHDEVIVQQGAREDRMYFVADGAVEVRGGEGRPVRLGTGDFFGGRAIVSPTGRRETSVVSLGLCRLLTLSRQEFKRLARADPEIGAAIRDAAEQRLSHGHKRRRPRAALPAAPPPAGAGAAPPGLSPAGPG
ncbi:cation:proton antiporter [Oceanicella sp. SM1341]|uniref:cation:proton antiporter n=1 Tax=Oceanicella sp. SM1341 TaxID=1548889 RepID=UPI0018E4DC56|nr:cation:proton antiporter [Oceanicella sp. SM1341]